MRPEVTLICAAVAALAPACAHAQGERLDYQVTGRSLAGRAEVTVGEGVPQGDRVHVSLRVERFHATGRDVLAFSGEGLRRRDGALEWSYLPAPGGLSGLGQAAEPVRVLMEARWGGHLGGTIDGVRQTWQPAPSPDDLVVLTLPELGSRTAPGTWGYLEEPLAVLRARGLRARVLPLCPSLSLEAYAEVVADEVRRVAGRRVVLLGHGWGATRALAAVALDAELRAQVAGVIALQPIQGGTPLAEAGAAAPAGPLAELIAARRDELTRAARRRFVAAHPYPASAVPTVVVRSSLEGATGDGVTSLEDQAVPGAAAVLDHPGLDHLETVQRRAGDAERPSPADVTNQALDALLHAMATTTAKAKEPPGRRD